MYLTLAQRQRAAVDPTVHDQEREDFNAYQRRARLVDQVDRAAARLRELERKAADDYVRPSALATARHRLDHFTDAAERAGLIRPRKDAA